MAAIDALDAAVSRLTTSVQSAVTEMQTELAAITAANQGDGNSDSVAIAASVDKLNALADALDKSVSDTTAAMSPPVQPASPAA